jgi:GT2 family glycosyltransferase
MDSHRNLGFGKGCNLAAKMATKEILFFINPDTVVSKGTFQSTLAYIESKPDAGAVGCKILNGDGSLQWACRRSFPSPFAAICKTIGLSALFPKSKIFASYNMTYLDPNIETEVDAVSGSFLGVKREIFNRLKGFDEDFFMYGEDLDICLRIKKLGYRNYYFPGTSILHFKGQSSKTRRFRTFVDLHGDVDFCPKAPQLSHADFCDCSRNLLCRVDRRVFAPGSAVVENARRRDHGFALRVAVFSDDGATA